MMIIDKMIYIKIRQTTVAVRLDRILYMEKRNRQIIIHVANGKSICFYEKFDSVMPMLDERFTHPHQSYVINMQQISRLGQRTAVLSNGDRIVMGNRCFSRLRKAFEQYIINNMKSFMLV